MFSGRLLVFALLALTLALGGSAVGDVSSIYWRFEEGEVGKPISSAIDSSGEYSAVANGKGVAFSDEVPMAVLPAGSVVNHGSVAFNGADWLRVKRTPELDQTKALTIEFWARFGPAPKEGEVLISKGSHETDNWHIVYRPDGSVRACVYGRAEACFFDAQAGGPTPGAWYHLAATYEQTPGGTTRIRTYLNGQVRDTVTCPVLKDTSGADLFIGSGIDGLYGFHGSIDELRITFGLLAPSDLLTAGARAIPFEDRREPVFVKPGTRVSASLRKSADGAPVLVKPQGYTYFFTPMFGVPVRFAPPTGTWDPGFAWGIEGSRVSKVASLAGYHFAVKPGGKYTVAIGFYDPATEPGKRAQRVVIDGVEVDRIDPAAEGHNEPFVKKYLASDANGDGYLQVSCSHLGVETDLAAYLSVIWIFGGAQERYIDAALLAQGKCDIPPMYYVVCGRDRAMPGHVVYPPLSAATRETIRAPRRMRFGLDLTHPQPPDPLDVEIRGELRDRIMTYMDRWGFAGRDQKPFLGFACDSGYETAGRWVDTLCELSRLMHVNLDIRAQVESLLQCQDTKSKYPGAFVGGKPTRTAFIWSQGVILNALMEYYETSGHKPALDSAKKLAGWYESYLNNGDLAAANYLVDEGRFTRDGATVGHIGKGALEGMARLYHATSDPKHLRIAKRIAELNRMWGGVAWMLYGDLPSERQQYEGWHIHANLTTVRGFPWLYNLTGDKSYLDDAIAACDRIYERATWGTGGVLEQIPWAGTQFPGATPDPHDEVCQTSDLLQLCYLLSDFTGETRFLDRADRIYYNHIRYSQMHNGNFSAFNRIPGPTRGGDAWFCCGFWGAKALYEVARHLYASAPGAVYVNGFMPSSANLKAGSGTVRIDTQADIPASGEVTIRVTPNRIKSFALNVRVPNWGSVDSVLVNGKPVQPSRVGGYVSINRAWKAGDTVSVKLAMPLRVVPDSSWDATPASRVAVGSSEPVDARYVSVFQGPTILARFRLGHGCDLEWAYSGDHPDLFDSLGSAADVIEAADWSYASESSPALTKVTSTPDGVRLDWELTPHEGWNLKRSALVRPGIPVTIEFASELTAPDAELLAGLKSVKTCGVRMRCNGFADYRHAALTVDGKPYESSSVDSNVLAKQAAMDNGYVRFTVDSGDGRMSPSDEGSHAAIYQLGSAEGNKLKSSCTLTITGISQFAGPAAGPKQ